jgi:hypothetical protein
MVEGALASGESVAIMARRYGVNANQLFHWRKLYQAGLLGTVPAKRRRAICSCCRSQFLTSPCTNMCASRSALNTRQGRSTSSFPVERWSASKARWIRTSFVPCLRACGDDSSQHSDMDCCWNDRYAARLHQPERFGGFVSWFLRLGFFEETKL